MTLQYNNTNIIPLYIGIQGNEQVDKAAKLTANTREHKKLSTTSHTMIQETI